MKQQAQKILEIYNSLEDKRPFTWLKGRSYSDAFVICVGAGPWKFARRKVIQQNVLDELCGRDISEIGSWHDDIFNWYPLAWQNQFLNNLNSGLIRLDMTMDYYCKLGVNTYNNNFDFIRDLHKKCTGSSKISSKVLSLFCRDSLGIPAFPIDRHVKRFLIQHKLPVNEEELIDLCFDAELKPSEVAVAFVRAASSMDNPDWSIA